MGFYETVRLRAKISENRTNQEWLLKQFPNNCSIQGIFDNKPASLISHWSLENTAEFDSTGYLETLFINSEYANFDQNATIRFFNNKERVTLVDSQKMICPIIYSSPFFLNEPHRYADFYAKAYQTKSLPDIIDFIKNHLIHSLRDIRLIDDVQRFAVHDEEFSSVMDITSYGEGLQRVFFISLLFASAENGILLLDEIENAIHVSLLDDFVTIIESLANKFNVQLFITSHSEECINSFTYHLSDINDALFCSLIKNDIANITPRIFNGAEFKRLINISKRDLRIAK